TDVAAAAVDEVFARYGVDTMIHGHTHRRAIHRLTAGGRQCRRIVLGDWYTQGSVLRVADGHYDLQTLPLALYERLQPRCLVSSRTVCHAGRAQGVSAAS